MVSDSNGSSLELMKFSQRSVSLKLLNAGMGGVLTELSLAYFLGKRGGKK